MQLVPLRTDECWQFLAEHHFGRVAIVVDGEPVVVPVNYAIVGQAVLFRVGLGSLLDPGEQGRAAAFEVDAVRPEYHTGLSVLVRGRATRSDCDALGTAAHLPLRSWVAHDESRCVEITGSVTGRRVTNEYT